MPFFFYYGYKKKIKGKGIYKFCVITPIISLYLVVSSMDNTINVFPYVFSFLNFRYYILVSSISTMTDKKTKTIIELRPSKHATTRFVYLSSEVENKQLFLRDLGLL